MPRIIGLFAGSGKLPVVFLNRAKKDKKKKFVTVAIEPYDHKLKELSHSFHSLRVTELGRCIEIFATQKISQLFTIGGLDIKAYLQAEGFGAETELFLKELKNSKDASFFTLFRAKLEKYGISVMDPRRYFSQEFVEEGTLTARVPSQDEDANINYGLQILNELGRIDTFQTIVMKKRRICALETIEGTNETILRGGKLAGNGTIVLKIANLKEQETCFHMPVVGYETIESMRTVGATALAIKAGEIYILEKDKVIEKANDYNITIKAMKPGE